MSELVRGFCVQLYTSTHKQVISHAGSTNSTLNVAHVCSEIFGKSAEFPPFSTCFPGGISEVRGGGVLNPMMKKSVEI